MQGVHLELTTASSPGSGGDSPEERIHRLISENPVIIFTRPACCMCHVMKRLLSTVGVHPTVIELDDTEVAALAAAATTDQDSSSPPSPPALYIGGEYVGGLQNLMELHLSNNLVSKLVRVGALKNEILIT